MSGWVGHRGGGPELPKPTGGSMVRPSDPRDAVRLLDEWVQDVAAVTGAKADRIASKVYAFVAVALVVAGHECDLDFVYDRLIETAPELVAA